LGTFSARVEACYALGLITEDEHNDVSLIRRIRNDFAHHIDTSFETPSVVSRCGQLKMKAEDYGEVKVGASGQFQTAAIAVISNLINRPDYVSKDRRVTATWPRAWQTAKRRAVPAPAAPHRVAAGSALIGIAAAFTTSNRSRALTSGQRDRNASSYIDRAHAAVVIVFIRCKARSSADRSRAPRCLGMPRPPADALLRADARGRDGGVREELAAGVIRNR